MKIQVAEGDCVSYLYLMGAKPTRRIRLSENLLLEPAACNPKPDDMIHEIMGPNKGSCSEVDLGILIATLRLTSAQLQITDDTAKNLAIRTWNAQTSITLLSALIGKEIYWHIQSDVEASEFSGDCRVNVIHHHLVIPHETYVIPESECAFIENSFVIAERLMDEQPFWAAVNSLWSYRTHPNPYVRMAVLWAGIESLFHIGPYELSNRLSTTAALFLETGLAGKKHIKKLYRARSKAVHEGQVKDKESVIESAELLRGLILKCIDRNQLPVEDELIFG